MNSNTSTQIQSNNRGEVLYRDQQYFQKQIDSKINQLVENYHSIVKISKINESIQNASEIYEMETRTMNILNSGEGLLKIIEELKQNLILNDFSAMMEEVRLQNIVYHRENDRANRSIKSIFEEVSKSLEELEYEYYNSNYKLPPTTSISTISSSSSTPQSK
ncbi:putative mediator complex subunit 22 [Tieghemostelium lacteum]|uniref:Putative mediator complex subunit 22 n=1 Tax=Tieghemostelium lacteum TaxID=361077 RepID=A0A151ZE26_TIELA|nr:putative mediator complex subunit 22 [Tieghemostelium lacteum]|eukprot:KYQ92212.1 putative mediator complex subunit 22 [Tieghemostelium lacteum]